jgi:2'-5' RNA ligase
MNLRLFIAVEPPESVRRKLAAMQAVLGRPDPREEAAGQQPGARPSPANEVKWVAPEAIHLTLQFLGAVPAENMERITAELAAAATASRPLILQVKGAGGFPNARRPRVLWAGLAGDVEPLTKLVQDLGRRLAPLGYPPEERPFSAHFTLARARDPRGAPGFGGGLAQLAAEKGVVWRAVEVCLFRSHLSPTGARYEVVARAPLGAPSEGS